MSISQVLKEKRKALGYTLLDIAKMMDVSEATVQRWESGNIKSLRYERIGKLAQILQVSPATLMGWEEQKEAAPHGRLEEKNQALYNLLSSMDEETLDKLLDFARFLHSQQGE